MDIVASQSVSQAWQEAVAAGRIINEFEAPADDGDRRWSKGDRIAFGLTLASAEITYFARNLTTSQPILASIEERTLDALGFVCQFNGYRALRPGGAPQRIGQQSDIPPHSSDCRFFCQDPKKGLSLLRRDPLVQVRLKHFRWNAYYNAAPFEKEGHFLWVPVVLDGSLTVIPHYIQSLTREFIEDALLLFRQTSDVIVFFNSLHAGASVNHIHLQAVFHQHPLAIERAKTTSYKGFTVLDGYPAHAFCFPAAVSPEELLQCVGRLQQREMPFNLIFVGSRILLVPRAAEHEIVAQFPGGVLATMELAGKIITVDRAAYEGADEVIVRSALGTVTVPTRSLIDQWRAA